MMKSDLGSLLEHYNEKVFQQEYKKNAVISLLFIIPCVFVYFHLRSTLSQITTQSELMTFISNFGLTIESLDNPSSFLMMHFTHLSWLHILPNCFFFFLIVRALSFVVNWKQVLFICLTAIVTTSLFSFVHISLFQGASTQPTIVIGFSGVAFATIGALFYYMDKELKIKNGLFLGAFHLVFFFIDGVNIAWYTHLYGFLTGLAFALVIKDTTLQYNVDTARQLALDEYKRLNPEDPIDFSTPLTSNTVLNEDGYPIE